MTTTVVGKESGIHIEVTEGIQHQHSRNPFYEIYVRGEPASGEVWHQMRLGNLILPIPLWFARDIKKVDKENPRDRMWDSHSGYLDISWTP